MKRMLPLGLMALALPVAAARLTITSYGVPHSYPVDPTDKVTFDENGLFLKLNSVSKDGVPSVRTFYLGYSNKVAFDSVGGALKDLFVLTDGSGTKSVSMDSLASIVFRPALDESGDDDGDGLTNLQELMIFHTDPRKKDTDGDGIDDYTETGWDPKVYSPLVANLPDIQVQLTKSPGISFNVTNTNTTSESVTATQSETFGTETGRSNSRSVMNSEQISTGFSLGQTTEAEASFFGSGVKFQSSWEFRFDIAQTHEVTNQWSYDQRKSYSQGLEEAKTKAIEKGTEVSGATVSVPMAVSNPGKIGVTLSGGEYTLYGLSYSNGQPIETALMTLVPQSGATSLNAGATSGEMVLTKDITLAQAEALQWVSSFTVRRTGGTLSYTVQSPKAGGSAVSLTSSDVSTSVGATTARVEVDFDNALANQESPMVRQVAVLNKPDATQGSYAPTYLGELLSAMGLTYSFDSAGFVDINGLKRNATNDWVAIKMTSNGGGKGYDTAAFNFKGKAGPDSIVVGAGDYVLIGYGGDDDRDSVPNVVEKFYGTYGTKASDFDGDGVSDHDEIYGRWINKGTKDSAYVFTNPKLKDTDGDGLNDKDDPAPLTPKLSSNSTVKTIVLTDNSGGVDSVKFAAASYSMSAAKALGASLKLKVILDEAPRWCKAVLNKGADTLVLTRDQSVSDKIAYAWAGAAPSFLVGANAVEVLTRSLDGANTKTWTVTGTSAVQVAPSLVASLKRDATKGWKPVATALLDIPAQMVLDPRTTGVLLLRSTTKLLPSVEALQSTDKPSGSFGHAALSIVYDYEMANGTAAAVNRRDSIGKSGRYHYVAVPYVLQGGKYFFPERSRLISDSVDIQKILVRYMIDSVAWNGAGDGSGSTPEIWGGIAFPTSAGNGTRDSAYAYMYANKLANWTPADTAKSGSYLNSGTLRPMAKWKEIWDKEELQVSVAFAEDNQGDFFRTSDWFSSSMNSTTANVANPVSSYEDIEALVSAKNGQAFSILGPVTPNAELLNGRKMQMYVIRKQNSAMNTLLYVGTSIQVKVVKPGDADDPNPPQ